MDAEMAADSGARERRRARERRLSQRREARLQEGLGRLDVVHARRDMQGRPARAQVGSLLAQVRHKQGARAHVARSRLLQRFKQRWRPSNLKGQQGGDALEQRAELLQYSRHAGHSHRTQGARLRSNTRGP